MRQWKEKMVEQGNQITFPLYFTPFFFLLYTIKKIRVRVWKKKSSSIFLNKNSQDFRNVKISERDNRIYFSSFFCAHTHPQFGYLVSK